MMWYVVSYTQLDLACSMSESLSRLTCRAASLFEFLMFRHGILAIHADFTRSDIDDFIRTVCEDFCADSLLF